MPTWTEALEAIRQDIVDINAIKDDRAAVNEAFAISDTWEEFHQLCESRELKSKASKPPLSTGE